MLEKISHIYHVQMNDLMKGNISKPSIIKYNISIIVSKSLKFILKHKAASTLIVLNVLAVILLAVLPVLPMWIFIQILMITTIILMSVKFSWWYVLLSVYVIVEFVLRFWSIVDTRSYLIKHNMGELDFIYSLGSLIALSSIGLIFLYCMYVFIKNSKRKYFYVIVLVTQFIWIGVCYLYGSSYSIVLRYSSFTQHYGYQILRSEYFWLFSLGYIAIIDALIWGHYLIDRTKIAKLS